MNEVLPEKSYSLGYHFLKAIWTLTLRPFLRISVSGGEHIPASGPFLLLANHTTWLDPAWLMVLCGRPVHFLAAAHWFNAPILGSILRTVGAIPKMKFTKDRSAVMQLVSLYESGKPVGQFPEGERNWDGKTLPVLPGVGRMILRLNARVLIARVDGGHQFFPRWSPRFRFVPLHITFLPVRTFDPSLSPEAVEDELNRLLLVDPDAWPAPARGWGWRMADGLPNLLWACPGCLEPEGLTVTSAGTAVACRRCLATWTVGIDGRLLPSGGPAAPLTIRTAEARIWEHFSQPPRIDPAKLEQEGVALETAGCILRPISGGPALAVGRAQLGPAGLRVVGDDGTLLWKAGLTELASISIEGSALLNFRLDKAHLALELGGESRVKWAYFLIKWTEEAKRSAGR